MSSKLGISKSLAVVLMSFGSVACSIPFVDPIFPDQKEDYKRAHELPSLEVPPELINQTVDDEYDGGTQRSVTAPAPVTTDDVQTQPLSSSNADVELVESGVDSHLLVRDNLRNTWRELQIAIEALEYDVEDVNRENSTVFLNIETAEGSSGMLSMLDFWGADDSSIVVYLLRVEALDNGMAIRVLDAEEARTNDDISKDILANVLGQMIL